MLPPPHPLHFAFVPSVSLSSVFLPLSLFCASFRGNLRWQLSFLLDVRCLRDSLRAITVPKGSGTRSSLPFQRIKGAAIGEEPLFGSDLRSTVWHAGPGTSGEWAFWLMSPAWSKTNPVCYSLLRVVTQHEAFNSPLGIGIERSRGSKNCPKARTLSGQRRMLR
jgi:hypothetical protein